MTIAGVLLIISASQAFADVPRDKLTEGIAAILSDTPSASATPDEAAVTQALAEFYAGRAYAPIWIGETGPGENGRTVLAALRNADSEGLHPAVYRTAEIGRLLEASRAKDLARLEVLLSHELLRYAQDVRYGRLAPGLLAPDLATRPPRDNLVGILAGAARRPIGPYLKDLAPANPGYRRLRRALATYHDIAESGGWPKVPEGPLLKRGMRGPRVATLRRHLEATGDVTVRSHAPEFFDTGLKQAVERYQARHGLEVDGVVGPKTRAQLSLPVTARIRQIEINMERWRWMPDDLGRRYVLVNLAGFEAELVEHGATTLRMRAVVGKPYRRTPVFSDEMTYVELNPTWTVPPTIMKNDLLPKLRQDVGYLAEQNMRVYAGWSAEAPRVDPTTIDWNAIGPRHIPYRFVQAPGPKNPLGRVKFMFPNRYHVYLHDTSQPELFERAQRTFSSGCIRIDKPWRLLERLLAGQTDWDQARIEAVLRSGKTTRVPLARRLPVHLIYATAWIGEGGTIHFRDDVYGRDVLVDQALSALELSQTAAMADGASPRNN